MSAPLPPPGARLMMILPPQGVADLGACLDAGDVAAVIWRGPPAADQVAEAQRRDVAALAEGGARAAVEGLDGAHVGDPAALKAALSALKPDAIVGAGGLADRHEAMVAGESGADYVLFGDLAGVAGSFPRTLDLAAWWAEVFEVPCVGVATSLDEVEALARAGVDFVALAGPLLADGQGPANVAAAMARIAEAGA
jgi:thiamine-phosphate pyrophosphorylase